MRYDDAVELLSQTVTDKNYALASHYALGQCYRAQGKMDNAVDHFLQVIKIVDLTSVNREQADDLISVYEGLAESYAAKGDRAKAEAFSRSLEEFLSSRGWEDKVSEVRRHLEALREADGQVSLAEAIEVPESNRVLEALALAQEYLRRDKLGAASDECFRAIELAPNYLPGHIRLAEILTKEGRLAEAQVKYQVLADLCLIRNDLKRVESIYRNSLKIVPDDVTTRAKLIDLYIQQKRTDEALSQYLELGEMYIRQNQLSKAIEKLNEGSRYAARQGVQNSYAMTLRHRLAEVQVRQGDFRNALGVYQEIHQQSPDDERAHFYIVDLEFRLGQTEPALRDLNELIAHYQAQNEPKKAIGVVEALAQNYPNEPALPAVLAQCYQAMGATDKAVAILDGLADSLLTKGKASAAAEVVRQIIALNPPRVEEYKAMLVQLSE
jgi:tetratricopeptide (TPR) repeat protein